MGAGYPICAEIRICRHSIQSALYCRAVFLLKTEHVNITLTKNIKWQFFAAVATGGICKASAMQIQTNLITISSIFCAGIIIYIGIMYVVRKTILKEFGDYLLRVAGINGEKA